MEVRDKLNPQRSYRKGFALKGLHQHIIKTNNPSTIGPGELLTVRFPDLKENQVIIPGTTKLTFNITLAGTDVNRTLWLDFRTIDDNRLHGLGRRLENTSEGILLQITKKAESAGKLSCYLYIFQDAQINISDAQFLNVVY